MASTASIASTANSSPGNLANSVSGQQKDGANKTPAKQNASTKMTDKGRRESPVDATRRSGIPKAWTSGTNPITQRSSTPPQPNGNSGQSKPSKNVSSKEQILSDRQSHERLRFLFGGALGLSVVITTKTGDKYEGVFAGSVEVANNTKIILKMSKKVQNMAITQPNGVDSREAAFVGSSPDFSLTFDLKDMADLTIPEFSLPDTSKHVNGGSTSFQTDADISGNTTRGERILQKWVPDGPDSTDFSLESGTTSNWDQFASHNKMFGHQSTYNEDIYTTSIDRSAPDYKRKEAEAARIAREIEGQTSTNAHVREERGQAAENDFEDEEEKYSGVRRDDRNFTPLQFGGANKYTPPARRAPTGMATVPGVPVDSAIISAQLSRPEGSKQTVPAKSNKSKEEPAETAEKTPLTPVTVSTVEETDPIVPPNIDSGSGTPVEQDASEATDSPQKNSDLENPSHGVENKVLDQFRRFANAERARLAEKKRQQANQDRSAKINDLLRFSKTFKLKTPIPGDLVGILAKDPKKQEAIMVQAQRDHEESKSTISSPPPSVSTSAGTALGPAVPKFDKSQIPGPIPDRNSVLAGRGGFAKGSQSRGGRPAQQQAPFLGPTVPSAPRAAATSGQREKSANLASVPAPIPLPEQRVPTGPMVDQSGLSSPRGSNTPSSAVSTKFNVRATEFRPTAAPFNPTGTSNPPTSPSSVARTSSVSRAASPSSFFGRRKPKSTTERLDISQKFNPIKRMKQEIEAKKTEKSEDPVRDYAMNGGIPNAYHTQPIWMVRDENKDRTYEDIFGKTAPPTPSPAQSRSGSSHTVPYHGSFSNMNMGQHQAMENMQHGHHAGPRYGHQFDDQRMHMQAGSPQVYASPNMGSRQLSAYASPMNHPAQLAYGQQPYFGTPNGPMQMRPYANTPGMMHAQPGQMTAPMMVQQHSTGPYMAVPPYNQMQMYSPTPAHVFPQQNGYPSPGRVAPMMMPQGSQQGHHNVQHMMYHNPGHGGPGGYGGHQQNMMRGGYGGHQTPYGSSPHQPHHMAQRAMSSGYGQKNIPQLPGNPTAPANAPQQPAAFAPMANSDEGK